MNFTEYIQELRECINELEEEVRELKLENARLLERIKFLGGEVE